MDAADRFIYRPYRPFAYPTQVYPPELRYKIDNGRIRNVPSGAFKQKIINSRVDDMEAYYFRHALPPNVYELWDYQTIIHARYIDDLRRKRALVQRRIIQSVK